jgi:hypothetical protein
MLKNRLKLKWGESRTPFRDTVKYPGLPTKVDDMSVKGYGEQHFTDSIVEDLPMAPGFDMSSSLHDQSGAWVEGNSNSPGRTVGISKIMTNSIQHQDRLLDSVSISLRNRSSRIPSKEVSSKMHRTHRDVSQSFIEEGYPKMIKCLVTDADFCYVESMADDFYRFGVKSTVPDHIVDNQYSTISKRGLLRNVGDNSELISLPALAHEANLYGLLGQLKLFRMFRVWKRFYVWKHTVRSNRFQRRKEEFEKNNILEDKLCRELIYQCRMLLAELQKEPLFYRDDTKMMPFADYLSAQREQNKKFAELKANVLQRIMELLCSRCEHYLFEAAANAPNAITIAKYQSLKLNALATSGSIQEVSNSAQKIVYMGLTSTNNAHNIHSSVVAEDASVYGNASVRHQNNLPEKPSNISPRARLASDKYSTASVVAGEASLHSKHEERKLVDFQGSSNYAAGKALGVGVSYTIRSAIRLNCRRLMALFRLIDFMIRDTLYDILRTNTVLFLKHLEKISVKNHVIPDFGFSLQAISDLDRLAEEFARHPKGASVAWAAKREAEAEAAKLKVESQAQTAERIGWSSSNASKLAAALREKEFLPATPLFTLGTEMHRRPIRARKSQIVASVDNSTGNMGSDEIKVGNQVDEDDTEHSSLRINFAKLGVLGYIAYLPSLESATENFQLILREVCLNCVYPEGLFFQERCIRMFEPVKNELSIHQLEDRVFLDNVINNPVQSILRSCTNIFVEDFRYIMDQFEGLNMLCVKGNLCETSCHQAISTGLHGISADAITAQLNVWDEQSALFGQLFNFLIVGIFRIDITVVKRNIVEIISKAQGLYVRLVPDLYVHYGDEFFRDVSKYTDNLVSKANSLEEFIKCVEAYNIAVMKVNDVNERFFYISSLRSIIEMREIPQSEGILRQNLTLSSAYQRFSNCVAEFESQVEMQIKVYGTEIANRLKSVMIPIQEFTDYIQSINHALMNETKEPDAASIVNQLTSIRKDIEQVGIKLKQLDYYQGLLNLSIFERGLEGEIEDVLLSQMLLWKSWLTYSELSGTFMAVHFLDANCDEILKDVILMRNELSSTRYFHQIRDMIANSDPNSADAASVRGIFSAYEMLLRNMKSLIQIAPLIKELQSPTLKMIHVDRIQNIIGQKIFDETELTVGELVDVHNIAQHALMIHKIYKESRILFQLESTLHNITKAANSLKFEFTAEQENKTLSFVSNFQSIVESIEDYTHSLFACRHSPFSSTIKKEIVSKLEELKEWIMMLRQFRKFQSSYLVLRSLFTSPRTARQISPYMRNFKAADENWRLLIKNSRDLEYVSSFLSERVVVSSLKHASDHISVIEDGFRDLRREQCEKYPKLYLMNDSALESIYTNPDIKSVFLECCKVVFPFLVEDVMFDYQEPYNVNTIICTGEKIVFQKSCSGRTNLSDWLKSCELAVKERLDRDLKSLMQEQNRSILDEIRNARFTGQAQIVKMQLKFWSSLDRILMDNIVEDKHEILAKLKAQLMDLNDQVTMVGSILSDPVDSRIVMLVSNVIITYAHFRDILQATYEDISLYLSLGNDSEGPLKSPFAFSALQYPLKKVFDYSTNTIMVQQGYFRERYGMVYQGFQAKMVITPLTERCIYALTTAFHSLTSRNHYYVPIVSGQSNSTTLRTVSYELGMEYFSFNVSCLPSAGQNFYEKLSNVLKILYTSSTVWVSLQSSEPLSTTHTAILGNVVSVFVKKMTEFQQIHYLQQLHLSTQTPGSAASNPSSIGLRPASNHDASAVAAPGSDGVVLPPLASGKLFLINAARLLPTIKTAQSTFAFLRPFHTPYVPLHEIIHVVLLSYNFVFIQKLVTQLEAFQTYMVNNGWVQENVFRRLLIRAIHALGVENEHQMMNASTQMSLIVKNFFSELLRVHRKIMSEQDLRLVYNLYFESVYNPDTDCPTTMTMQIEQKEAEGTAPIVLNEDDDEQLKLSAAQRSPQRLLCELLQQQNYRLQMLQTKGASTVFRGDPNIVNSIDETRHAFYCVVGVPGVGKTTLIKKALNNLAPIFAATPQKILDMLPEYIRVHPHRLNPALLNNRAGSMIFGDIDDSHGLLRALGEPMKTSVTNRDWHFFHFDVWNSTQYLDYLIPAQRYLHQRFPLLAASVFCEMTDLQDLTPTALSSIKLIWMPKIDREYSFDDILDQCIKKYETAGGQAFRTHIKAMSDCYIRQCLTNYPGIKDFSQDIYVLVDRILHLTVLLFQYFVFPSQNSLGNVSNTGGASMYLSGEEFKNNGIRKGISTKSLGRYDENNLRRVMLFACIWVIGNCSFKHREEFEQWFRSTFLEEHIKEYVERKKVSVFPFVDIGPQKPGVAARPSNNPDEKWTSSRSIFDYVLQRTEGKTWTLEWIHAGKLFIPKPKEEKDSFTAFSVSRDSLLFTDQLLSSNRAMCIVPTIDFISLSLVHAAMMHTTGFLEQRASGLLLYSKQHGTGRTSLMQNLASQVTSPDNPSAFFETSPRWIYYGRDDKSAIHVQKAITTAQIRFEHQRIERGLLNFGAIFIDDVSLLSENHPHHHDGVVGASVSRGGEVLRALLEQKEYFDPSTDTFRSLWYPAVVASMQLRHHGSRSEGDRAWLQQFHRFAQHFFLYEVTPMQVRSVLSNFLRMQVGWGVEYGMLGEIGEFTHYYFEQLHRVVSLETEKSTWLSERSYSASERILLITLRDTHPSVWSAWITKQMAASILSLESVSQIDIIRVWDRLISDLSVRHILYPKIQDLLAKTMEFCLNGPPNPEESLNVSSDVQKVSELTMDSYGTVLDMSSSSIASMLEKERSVRMANLDILQQSAIAPRPDDAISYARNCVGFFRTGHDVFPTLYTMEYVRDTIWKHLQEEHMSIQLAEEYPFYSMLLRTQRNTAGFWTDILRFVTVIACNQLSYSSSFQESATPTPVETISEGALANPRAIMLVPTTNMHLIHPRVFFASHFFSNMKVETLSIGCAKVRAVSALMMGTQGGDIEDGYVGSSPDSTTSADGTNDLEMRLIRQILLDVEVLSRFKQHLASYECTNLVDPMAQKMFTARYGKDLGIIIAQAESIFETIDSKSNPQEVPMPNSFAKIQRHHAKETVWIIENDDDFTGDSHDPRRIDRYFHDIMQMMSLDTPQILEFVSLLNPLLDPRLYDNVRRALINFQQRQHIVFSVRCLYADQLGHLLRTTKRLVKVIHLHPESDEAEKLTKSLEALPDKLEIGMDRSKFMQTLHGFADWYRKERSSSLNRMVFDIEEYNIFDMVQRLLQKEDDVKNVDLRLKLLHYLIRITGYVEPKSAHGETQALFLPQMITWEGPINLSSSSSDGTNTGLRRASASFASKRRSSTGALMVGPAYAASFVLACDMMFVSSALHCDAWVTQHTHHHSHVRQHHLKLPHRKDLQQLSVEATIHENAPLEMDSEENVSVHPPHHSAPIPDFLYHLLEPLLHENFLKDIKHMQSLLMTMAMTQCLSEVPFTTPKWNLLHKLYRLFLLLPRRSTCKGFLASLSYGIASEATLIINDYTFLVAPFLDNVLDHDLHLGTSAANMSDVNLNVHCLSWKIHAYHHYQEQQCRGPDGQQPTHKRKHDIEDLASTTINITRADVGIATDLMLIHLLENQMFANLQKDLQEAWNRKIDTVRHVLDTLRYLTDNLQEYEQLPGMKFQSMFTNSEEEEEFDRLWHDSRHRLLRAMEANIVLSTNIFKSIRTYEKTRQFMAWFSSFLVLLEDSILFQDHDTNGEELSHNIGLASMKALSMLTPHMITHEGDRLWLLLSIFLDYIFVVDGSRSEYVFGEQGRMQFLQCLHSLSATEAITKDIGLDAFLGIVKKEKIVSNQPKNTKRNSKLGRHPSGIHAIAEEDSGNEDDSTNGDHSSRAETDTYTGDTRNILNDLVHDAGSFKEYTVIANHSRMAIKQTLQTISQVFSSGSLNHSFYATYCSLEADAVGGPVERGVVIPCNSLTILTAIDSAIDEWIEWASDTTTDLQEIPWNTGDERPPLNPLEEVLLILALKPALLPQILFDKICLIGYDVDPVTVRALLLSEDSLKRGFHHTGRISTLLQKSLSKYKDNDQGRHDDIEVLYFGDEDDDGVGCVLHSGGSAQRQGFPIIFATADEEEMVLNQEDENKRRSGRMEQKIQAMMNKRSNRTRSYTDQSYFQNDTRLIINSFLSIPSDYSLDSFQTSLEALITFLKQELSGGNDLCIPPSLLIASMSSDRNHGSIRLQMHRQRSVSSDYSGGGGGAGPNSGIGSETGTAFGSPRRSIASDGANAAKNNQVNPLTVASAISFDMTNRPCTLAIRLLFENTEQTALAMSMNATAGVWFDEASAFLNGQNTQFNDNDSVVVGGKKGADVDPFMLWSSAVSATVLPVDDENEADSFHCDTHRHWKVFPLARIKQLIQEQYPNLHVVFYADDGSDHIFELNEIPDVETSAALAQRHQSISQPSAGRNERMTLSVRFDASVENTATDHTLMLPSTDMIHKYHWGYPYYTPLMPTHSEYSDELILWRLRNNLRVLLEMGPSSQRPWLNHHALWTYLLINHSSFQQNPLHAQSVYSSLRQPVTITTAKRDLLLRIMDRLRWLLVLFHTALPFSSPKDSVEYSDNGDTSTINSEAPGQVDQILQYYDYRDEALCKAVEIGEELIFHHVSLLLEPVFRAPNVHQAYSVISRATSASSEGGSPDDGMMSAGESNPFARAESANATTPVTVNITDQFLLVLQDAILHGAYHGNDLGIHDYGHELRMRSVFQSIFAPHCLDVQVAYTVLNAIPVPSHFDSNYAQAFVNQLSDHIESNPDCGFFEDLGYLNISLCHHRNYIRWESGMKRFLLRQTFLPAKDLHHHPSCSTSGLLLSENTVFRYSRHMNDDIREGLRRFLDLLPEEIDFNSKEFHRQMQSHCLQSDQHMTTFKGRQTRVGAGPQMSTLAQANSEFGQSNKSRRAGQRMLLRFQTHEYDTYWAFLLSEIVTLNRRIRNWRDYLNYLMTLDTNGWKEHVLLHLPGRQCDDDWQDMFLQLQAGCVPNIWCSGSFLYYIFEAGYNGSRCSQHLHHTLGHHQRIPILSWMNHLFRDGHSFLLKWLQSSQHPKQTPVPWHVFSNPEGFLYALKESFCMQTDTSVDKVHLHTRLSPMPKPDPDGKPILATTSEEQVQSLGCYVQFGPLYLMNGLYSQRSDSVDLLPSFYVMQYGGSCQSKGHANTTNESALSLHVWISLESQGLNTDQYLCPVFMRSMASPRSLIQRDQHTALPPILRVPCNTSEDIPECEIQRMALFSGPNWLI